MSQHNFHSLYVAPLIVGILTAVIAGVGAYYFTLSPAVPSTLPPAPPPVLPLQGNGTSPADEITFPKDTATQNLLRDFLNDPAAAAAKYRGNEVQVCSVIAMIEPSGVLELYGAPVKNRVEGIYFKCSLQKNDDVKALKPNQLVMLKGRIDSYFHHPKSPYIVIESCLLVQP